MHWSSLSRKANHKTSSKEEGLSWKNVRKFSVNPYNPRPKGKDSNLSQNSYTKTK